MVIQVDDKIYTICNLYKEKIDRATLDIFVYGNQNVKLKVVGNGEINVCGYFETKTDFTQQFLNEDLGEEEEEVIEKKKEEEIFDEDIVGSSNSFPSNELNSDKIKFKRTNQSRIEKCDEKSKLSNKKKQKEEQEGLQQLKISQENMKKSGTKLE